MRFQAEHENRLMHAFACLYLAVKEPREYHDGTGGRPKKLFSFGWIAVTTALKELQKLTRD